MASAGQLFLLLVLSSLLVSTVSVSTNQLEEVSPQELNKVKEGLKATGKVILKTIDQIRIALVPFLALIPVYGPCISAIATLALVGVSEINKNLNDKPILDALRAEFESLNMKLDQYHVEQKWDSWASGAYYKPEKNIDVAWTSYQTMTHSILLARDERKRKRHVDEFISAYAKYEPATKTLHKLLTAKGTTFVNNMGDMLGEHVKCHEKDVREYLVFVGKLIYKANTMNEFYYRAKKIESLARVNEEAQITYDAASVMFGVLRDCIIRSMEYVKKDVKALIDKTQKRDKLAEEVRRFLDKTYDRYDWMVVAFITKNSKHKIVSTRNKHVLTGFTEVPEGYVTVAVARQVKGTHTKAREVANAIDRCLARTVLCYQVAKKLSECRETVGMMPVSQTYTAVHAFTRKPHDSHNAIKVPEDVSASPDDRSAQTPHIYIGRCEKSPGMKVGKFVVMIKSDEEMMTKDPCTKLDCGGQRRGSCVRMKDAFVAMCQCKPPYYGQRCEQSLDDYKKALQQKVQILVVDRRRRMQPPNGF